MGVNDNYQFGRTQPLGKISFGDASYADQFLRAPTADLSSARKKTAPLNITKDLVEQALAQADDRLRTCRIILDKFDSRMRILQWAEEASRQPVGALPETTPAPESQPLRKGFFGKKELPARPPAKPKNKAARAAAGPKTSMSLSGQEQALAIPVANIISQDPQARRQVQVALYQYAEAVRAVEAGMAGLTTVSRLDPKRAFDEIEKLDVAKIQGKIYPLTNFHEAFKAHPEISRFFPAPPPRK